MLFQQQALSAVSAFEWTPITAATKVLTIKTYFKKIWTRVYSLHDRQAMIVTRMNQLGRKDPATLSHLQRTAALSRAFAFWLKENPPRGLSSAALSELDVELVTLGAQLHDIGKMAIPNFILKKPGRLNVIEKLIMNLHASIGFLILWPSPELRPAAEIARSHHERWDGQGYPRGLKKNEISLATQVVSLADTYDTMTEDRPYRRAQEKPKDPLNELRQAEGQFNPELADAFIAFMRTHPVYTPEALPEQVGIELGTPELPYKATRFFGRQATALWRIQYDSRRMSLETLADRLRTLIGPYDVNHPQTVREMLEETDRLLAEIQQSSDPLASKEDIQTLDLMSTLFQFRVGLGELMTHHPLQDPEETLQHYLNGFWKSARQKPHPLRIQDWIRYHFFPSEQETWFANIVNGMGHLFIAIPVVLNLAVQAQIITYTPSPLTYAVLILIAAYIFDPLSQSQRLLRLRHDAMTQLLTPHYLDLYPGTAVYHPRGRLMRMVRRALRDEEAVSVISLDLDDFGQVNTEYGGSGADHILQQVAKRLVAAKDPNDLIIRRGGEEILIICPNTNVETARLRAERFRQLIATSPIPMGKHVKAHVTMSLGVAQCPVAPDSAWSLEQERAAWIKAADDAMKESKKAKGKNTTTVSTFNRDPVPQRFHTLKSVFEKLYRIRWSYFLDAALIHAPLRYVASYLAGLFLSIAGVYILYSQLFPLLVAIPFLFLAVRLMIETRYNYLVHLEYLDAKTGALSFRYLDTFNPNGYLANIFKRVNNDETSLTGVFIDVNNFKQINDIYGHDDGGDPVLQRVSGLLMDHFGSDRVIRIRGKMFLVLTEKISAWDLENNVRDLTLKINALEIQTPKGPLRNISVTSVLAPLAPARPNHSGKTPTILTQMNQWLSMGEEASDAAKGRSNLAIVSTIPKGRPGRNAIPDDQRTELQPIVLLKNVAVTLPFASLTYRGQHGDFSHLWSAIHLEHLLASIAWAGFHSMLLDPEQRTLQNFIEVYWNGKRIWGHFEKHELTDNDHIEIRIGTPAGHYETNPYHSLHGQAA